MELEQGCFVGWAGSPAGGVALGGQGREQGAGGVKPGAGLAVPQHGDGVGNGTSRGGSVVWELGGQLFP